MAKSVSKKWKKKNKKKGAKKIKGTLDKKIRKSLKKDLDKAFEIKSLEKAREHCNHRDKKGKVSRMTVEEFKNEGMEFLIPNLQTYVETFGEENVYVCPNCYTPMVSDVEAIDIEAVKKASVLIEAMGSAIVVNSRKEKEIEAYRKVIRDSQKTSRFITKKFRKIVGKAETGQQSGKKITVNTMSSKPREL